MHQFKVCRNRRFLHTELSSWNAVF